MFLKPLEYLENRVAPLGNHFQKYLHTIRLHKEPLVHALDRFGKLMQVDLGRHSFSLDEEMTIIKSLSPHAEKQIHFLSCYYAFQYLHMNFRNLDVLAMELASGETPAEVYYRFMMNVDHNFTELNRHYLHNLLDIHLPRKKWPRFFICSLGTTVDQDDIDLGIVTADDADATELNNAFKKITQNMLVYATPLHLYLSESVGKQRYTKTVSECTQIIGAKVQDIVVVSELLNAKMIFGNESLFGEFQNRVVERYFYQAHQDNRYHEFFLRGILGEARAMLLSPPQSDAVSPKHDVLRILKSVLMAKKTATGIHETSAWDMMTALKSKEPHHHAEYTYLYNALSFLEIFKFLLQMCVIQEDTFRLLDIDHGQLDIVAEKMGYEAIGTVSAWDQVIIAYYNQIKDVRKLCEYLLKDTSIHLSDVSMIVKILKAHESSSPKQAVHGSLPRDMMQHLNFFAGTKYWDDVLGLMESNEALLGDFIDGFDVLDKKELAVVINNYVQWTQYAPLTIIKLITLIGRKQMNLPGETVFKEMCRVFVKYVQTTPDTIDRLTRIYSLYPEAIHEFLQILPEHNLEVFEKTLAGATVHEKLREYYLQFKELCSIHRWSGQYFHRFFHRVIANHPEHLNSLTRPTKLSRISKGLLAMVDVCPTNETKKKILGDYYDLEFLRVGIGTLHGEELQTTNREFTEFCDNYIRELFHICEKEIEAQSGSEVPSADNFAILVAGGHGRMEAYDDDYDLIAIVDDNDPAVLKYTTRIVTRMNREILKRGLLPHYRLAEKLGGFVNTTRGVSDYFLSEDEEVFIDLSQILGARMIIGSEEMEFVVRKDILEKYIFRQKAAYIRKMCQEIHSRQHSKTNDPREFCQIKETTGGLRDIEAVALILKAFTGRHMILADDFFTQIKQDLPSLSFELDAITETKHFLRTIRDLYRLVVAAEEEISQDHLVRLVSVFKGHQYKQYKELKDAKMIMQKIRATLKKSAAACDVVMDYVLKAV
ncbi:MAG: hypothetical protein HQM16_08305 [Deltaproteobacteria bacterium]|nr:hypothetical protein [Deltaproteobacteria bacterium]